ncbi:MAG: MFS transporter, partial [Halobacteriales archaeon]
TVNSIWSAASVRRGRSAGFFGSAQAAGDMGGQALVGVLLGLLAPSGLYLAIAAISLLGTIVVTQITEPIAAEEESDRPSLRELSRQARGRVLPTPTERAMLRDSGLGWLYVGLALRHLGVKGIGSLIPIYLVAEVGTSEAMMGLLLTVSPAAQIGLMALLGQQADIGSRKQLIVFGIIASGLYGILLAVAVLPAGMAFRLLIAGGSFLAIAAGFSAMDIGVIAVIGDLVPASRESAFLGLRSTAAGVGGVIGPLSVGILAVLVGYGIAFTMAGVFTALSAIVIVLKVPETTGDKGSLSANAHSSGVETQTDLARLSQLHQQRRAVHPVDDN